MRHGFSARLADYVASRGASCARLSNKLAAEWGGAYFSFSIVGCGTDFHEQFCYIFPNGSNGRGACQTKNCGHSMGLRSSLSVMILHTL